MGWKILYSVLQLGFLSHFHIILKQSLTSQYAMHWIQQSVKMQDGFGTGGMSAESMWECSLSLDNRVDLNMFLHFNRYVEGLAGEMRYL